MTDIVSNISTLIESQFPDIYKEEGQQLVAFLEAYYEFLESNPGYSINLSRNMFTIRDIDTTLDQFVVYFKEKYLKDFPFVAYTDKRFLVKNIIDLYRSKGSERSIKLLINILFGENTTEVYTPGQDILRASDSIWFRPTYLELTKSSRTPEFVGKQIVGSNTGAKAFVEGLISKRVNGKIIDVLYISNVQGNFTRSELVTENGDLARAPKIIGSLTSIEIELGGRDNQVGDVFNVVSENGKQGKIRVTETAEATGRVDFEIIDGGYGYTSTENPDITASDVYVATAMLDIDNSDLDYILYENVAQRIETLTTLSATDINSAQPGDFILGIDGSGTQVANGIVISVANTDANGSVISTASANSIITLQAVDGTTFNDLRLLQTSNSKAFFPTEYIEEESELTVQISDVVGSFSNGDIVFQIERDNVGNNVIGYAFGTVVSANSTELSITEAWGEFSTNLKISVESNTSIEASVDNISITSQGALGQVTSVDGANVSVRDITGSFTANKKIRGVKTLLIDTIDTVIDSGATDLWLSGNSAANGVIDTVANNYTTGFVVGQNTSSIGVFGNTTPFYQIDGANLTIETIREELLSPLRDANGDIIEVESSIIDIKSGQNANFDIGFLENSETISLNTDLIGGTNIYGVPYVDIGLDGSNSGVGFVDNITINDGGTQYSNGSIVSFDNGGFAGGDPLFEAEGVITTDANGTIIDIIVSDPGAGYYQPPTINLPVTTGDTANVEIVMDFGYGFPADPNSDHTTILENLLTNENFTIGSIASLTKINPGQNYNVNPFVRIRNDYVASFNKSNLFIEIDDIIGSFVTGEIIEQEIDSSTTAKGKVLSFEIIESGKGFIELERTSFNVSFDESFPITGSITGTTANIVKINNNVDSDPLGDNANILATSINASGIATGVEVIDSGYGYIENDDVILERDGFEFVITGKSKIINQGISEGFWKTTTSHLNSDKKIHDNVYYQEFSYDIRTGLFLNKYLNIIKDVVHMSGNEIFGTFVNNSKIELPVSFANSSIEIN